MGEYMKTSPESPVGPAQKINMIHIARGMVQGALVPLAQERGEGRVTVRSNRPPSDPCNSSPPPPYRADTDSSDDEGPPTHNDDYGMAEPGQLVVVEQPENFGLITYTINQPADVD